MLINENSGYPSLIKAATTVIDQLIADFRSDDDVVDPKLVSMIAVDEAIKYLEKKYNKVVGPISREILNRDILAVAIDRVQ